MTTITYNGKGTIIGLSTEDKPTTNIVDGMTCLEVDTKKVFVFYSGQWYEI